MLCTNKNRNSGYNKFSSVVVFISKSFWVLQNHLCTQFFRNRMGKTIFFSFTKWNLWSRAIIFNIMHHLKISILTLSLTHFILEKNKFSSFLCGFNLLFPLTCFCVWLVGNLHGNYGTRFNCTFSCLLELVFDNFTMISNLSLLIIALLWLSPLCSKSC